MKITNYSIIFFALFSVNLSLGMKKKEYKTKFWIGIKIDENQLNFKNLQENYLKSKITRIPSEKYKMEFFPIDYPHITFAEGEIISEENAKKEITDLLKKIEWNPLKINIKKNLDTQIEKLVLGQEGQGKPGKRFVVLFIDETKSKDLFALGKKIRNELIDLEQKTGSFKIDLYGRNPEEDPILHISMGKINPPIKGLYYKQKDALKEILEDIDPHDKYKSPYLSQALENYKIVDFDFVITPPKSLTPEEMHSEKYVVERYKSGQKKETFNRDFYIKNLQNLHNNLLGLKKQLLLIK